MRFEIRDITPAWAQQILDELERRQAEGKFQQRPPRWGAIQRYVNDMEQGNWALTHECVAFDTAGNLIDGQNRLRAVVDAGVTVRMAVCYNVPERQGKGGNIRTMDNINTGVPRNVWMALRISHGYGGEAIELASYARNVTRFVLLAPGQTEPVKGVGVSAAQTLFILEKMGYREAGERLRVLVPHKKLRSAPFAAVWCWWWHTNEKAAEKFAVSYEQQVNLGKTDPALVYYRYVTMTTKRPRSHEQSALRTASQVLRSAHTGQPLSQIKGSDEAYEFMINLNPKHRTLIEEMFVAQPAVRTDEPKSEAA